MKKTFNNICILFFPISLIGFTGQRMFIYFGQALQIQFPF